MKITKKRTKVILLPTLFFILTYCISIPNVTQPTTAVVGEEITITVDVEVSAAETAAYNVIFGVLVPESWDVASSAEVSYTSPNGSGTFSLAPDQTYSNQMMEMVGIGENYGRVQWVTYISDDVVSGTENENFSGQVQLTFNVGDENIKTQLGYVVADTNYGITLDNGSPNFGSRFTDCFEVTGGTNALIDLCGPLPFPVTLQPEEYTLDDVIKISFDATKGELGEPTALLDAENVFLCGTVTANGTKKEICTADAANMLTKVGPNLWEISIWAKQFFDLPLDAEISAISFSFTNAAGDILVQNPDTGTDFQITPTCTF